MHKKRGGHGPLAGFSIIEVVLVLAIAGLIFLIVFLAVPALQRQARDQQRKTDLVLLKAAVENWRSNNKGNNLDTAAELAQISADYFELRDPSTGNQYTLTFTDHYDPHVTTVPPLGEIIYHVGHICGSDPGTNSLTTNHVLGHIHSRRIYALLMSLEAPNLTYCQDIITEN